MCHVCCTKQKSAAWNNLGVIGKICGMEAQLLLENWNSRIQVQIKLWIQPQIQIQSTWELQGCIGLDNQKKTYCFTLCIGRKPASTWPGLPSSSQKTTQSTPPRLGATRAAQPQQFPGARGKSPYKYLTWERKHLIFELDIRELQEKSKVQFLLIFFIYW